MRTINTQQDVEDLRRNGTAPATLSEHIATFFRQLEAELANEEGNAFRLYQHGPIILLEAGDELPSQNFAGRNDDNLCGAVEFVERLDLGELQAYRLVVLLDNDFVVTYFTLVGIHDEEAEQWLSEQAQRG